jgi:acyl carrier protein
MSEFNFEAFLAEVANDLEIDDALHLKLPLIDIPEFDSMGKITVSLTIERFFSFQIPYDVLDKVDSFYTLFLYCQNFSKE